MPQTRQAEAPRMKTFIIDTLRADTTLMAAATGDVWPGMAPDDVTDPYVAVSYIPLPDVFGLGVSRVMAAGLWRVEAIGNAATDDAALTIIADRIDLDLHGASGVTADGRILGSIRQAEVEREEVIADIVWLHRGGDYRLYAQPLVGA